MSKILAMGCGLLTLAALSATHLAAQDPEAQDPAVEKSSQTWSDPVISLEFAGGSLAKFAAALRKVGDDVNIVMPKVAEEVELPSLTLSQATVESALNSIAAVVSDDFRIRVKTLRSQFGKPVYAVSVVTLRSRKKSGASNQAEQANSGNRVEVVSLKYLTDTVPGDGDARGLTLKAETILTAVDTGFGIRAGASKPELRYHQDSGLLFVKGLARELDLVKEVIGNLENDLRRLRRASANVAALKKAEDRRVASDAKRDAAQGK